MVNNTYKFLLSDLKKIKGVGVKTANILKRKKINNIFDLLWRLPKSYTDRTKSTKIKDLKLGETQTITLVPYKYNFPRIRNLPNRIYCRDDTGEMDCVFFNSYEGYIKKILPLNKEVTISGKISRFKNKYQITNPKYISENASIVKDKHNKYSLTEGISEKIYNKIIAQILSSIPKLDEWHEKDILKKFDNISWNESLLNYTSLKILAIMNLIFIKDSAYDEILASFLVHSEIRKKIKKLKRKKNSLIQAIKIQFYLN